MFISITNYHLCQIWTSPEVARIERSQTVDQRTGQEEGHNKIQFLEVQRKSHAYVWWGPATWFSWIVFEYLKNWIIEINQHWIYHCSSCWSILWKASWGIISILTGYENDNPSPTLSLNLQDLYYFDGVEKTQYSLSTWGQGLKSGKTNWVSAPPPKELGGGNKGSSGKSIIPPPPQMKDFKRMMCSFCEGSWDVNSL